MNRAPAWETVILVSDLFRRFSFRRMPGAYMQLIARCGEFHLALPFAQAALLRVTGLIVTVRAAYTQFIQR